METIGYLRGMVEVLMQCVDVLENAAAPADNKVVNGDDMLGVLGEGNSADMLEMPQLKNQHTTLTLGLWSSPAWDGN